MMNDEPTFIHFIHSYHDQMHSSSASMMISEPSMRAHHFLFLRTSSYSHYFHCSFSPPPAATHAVASSASGGTGSLRSLITSSSSRSSSISSLPIVCLHCYFGLRVLKVADRGRDDRIFE
eukprot:GHVU01082429.1.p1 GENE.GHVU01082429.1~~GHVU01082429.1.p1  ORF type:complete len:120 (+),score=4.97 GHVU01082429.1:151-510(+)